MSRTFVDTSAIIALLVSTDRAHQRARSAFDELRAGRARLVTTSYVLVESYALIRKRLGTEAVRAFRERFEPLLEIVWIDGGLHGRALDDLLGQHSKTVSLVDAASFVVMRHQKIGRAFAFDRHFEEEGFETVG